MALRALGSQSLLLKKYEMQPCCLRDDLQKVEIHVLHCMRGNTTKVKNIKKYLLAALFNAPSTMNGYYQAEVNHDMPGLVR